MRVNISGKNSNHIYRSENDMKCNEFQELMYLRDDELDAGELSELKRHRSECTGCAAEYERAESIRKITDLLKVQNPVLSDPLILMNSVLSRIENDALKVHASRSESAFDRFVAVLAEPRLRIAMVSLLFIITGTFTVEYTSAYVYMKSYEVRIDKSSSQQEDAAAMLIGQGNLLTTAEDLSKLISGKQSFVEVSENWVMINKNSLEKLLLLYDELKDNASQLSPEFHAVNPRLSKLLAAQKQSTQLDLLLKERESLIRELDRLIPKERKTP
jgi:hypothetical protein